MLSGSPPRCSVKTSSCKRVRGKEVTCFMAPRCSGKTSWYKRVRGKEVTCFRVSYKMLWKDKLVQKGHMLQGRLQDALERQAHARGCRAMRSRASGSPPTSSGKTSSCKRVRVNEVTCFRISSKILWEDRLVQKGARQRGHMLHGSKMLWEDKLVQKGARQRGHMLQGLLQDALERQARAKGSHASGSPPRCSGKTSSCKRVRGNEVTCFRVSSKILWKEKLVQNGAGQRGHMLQGRLQHALGRQVRTKKCGAKRSHASGSPPRCSGKTSSYKRVRGKLVSCSRVASKMLRDDKLVQRGVKGKEVTSFRVASKMLWEDELLQRIAWQRGHMLQGRLQDALGRQARTKGAGQRGHMFQGRSQDVLGRQARTTGCGSKRSHPSGSPPRCSGKTSSYKTVRGKEVTCFRVASKMIWEDKFVSLEGAVGNG